MLSSARATPGGTGAAGALARSEHVGVGESGLRRAQRAPEPRHTTGQRPVRRRVASHVEEIAAVAVSSGMHTSPNSAAT